MCGQTGGAMCFLNLISTAAAEQRVAIAALKQRGHDPDPRPLPRPQHSD